jgi:hypothetical protein
MGEVKSARQKVEEEKEKLRAEVRNAPGWHRKAQPDEDCDGCDEEQKAQKAKTEV